MITIKHSDAFDFLISQRNINLLLTDPPYGVTGIDWDTELDAFRWWDLVTPTLAEDAVVIMTATQPFASRLIVSSPLKFRQELIWEKPNGTGQVKYGPNRVHENILVWVKGKPVYNPQMTEGKPYTWNSERSKGEATGFSGGGAIHNTGTRHPRSVIQCKQQRGLHPTQKPESLFEFLIQSYSQPGDLVCDPFVGSGTTAVSAFKTGRRFTGCDISIEYVKLARSRCH